ncbi:MAG: RNA methyltransferase [Anaerolineales bacterium]|nr:RNA methyltransferase [Anaerolineales bacterium]
MSITRITSRQNGRIKDLIRLNQRRQRDARQLTLIEGEREVARALQQGIVPREAYLCPELLSDAARPVAEALHALGAAGQTALFEVAPDVFDKIAYRGESGCLLVVIPYLARALAALPAGPGALLVVIEGAEKPGNLGAILRTADAAGVDGVIVSQEGTGTDIHNPNVIRASLGTLFAVPVAVAPNAAIVAWLRQHGVRIVAATPEATRVYTAVDFTQPTAIVAGSEALGLSDTWRASADTQVTIPMRGIADSLNLATSVAILLYEAVRQRS